MSILSDVPSLAPTTAPALPADAQTSEIVGVVVLLVMCAGSIALAAFVGIFRRRSVIGPPRVSRDRRLGPLILAFGVAITIWLGLQIGYVAVRAADHLRQHGVPTVLESSNESIESSISQRSFTAEDLTPADFAFLATVPGLIALAAIIVGDRLAGRGWFHSLGWAFNQLPRGVGTGIVASLIALPLVYASTAALDWIYQLIDFKHPEAHELLGALASSHSRFLRFAMIAGAAVVAPVWEEVAFRGHLQTLIGGALFKLFSPRPAIALPAELMSSDVIIFPSESPTVEPVALELAAPIDLPVGPTSLQRWIAIIMTSCIFAGVHEMWTWPAIFILSICLGYAYERTGNLWTSIVLHLAFNSISTAIFLSQVV